MRSSHTLSILFLALVMLSTRALSGQSVVRSEENRHNTYMHVLAGTVVPENKPAQQLAGVGRFIRRTVPVQAALVALGAQLAKVMMQRGEAGISDAQRVLLNKILYGAGIAVPITFLAGHGLASLGTSLEKKNKLAQEKKLTLFFKRYRRHRGRVPHELRPLFDQWARDVSAKEHALTPQRSRDIVQGIAALSQASLIDPLPYERIWQEFGFDQFKLSKRGLVMEVFSNLHHGIVLAALMGYSLPYMRNYITGKKRAFIFDGLEAVIGAVPYGEKALDSATNTVASLIPEQVIDQDDAERMRPFVKRSLISGGAIATTSTLLYVLGWQLAQRYKQVLACRRQAFMRVLTSWPDFKDEMPVQLHPVYDALFKEYTQSKEAFTLSNDRQDELYRHTRKVLHKMRTIAQQEKVAAAAKLIRPNKKRQQTHKGKESQTFHNSIFDKLEQYMEKALAFIGFNSTVTFDDDNDELTDFFVHQEAKSEAKKEPTGLS